MCNKETFLIKSGNDKGAKRADRVDTDAFIIRGSLGFFLDASDGSEVTHE